jgi:flagellar motor switch protein FliN
VTRGNSDEDPVADQLLKPDEIEALLKSAGAGTPQAGAAPAAPAPGGAGSAAPGKAQAAPGGGRGPGAAANQGTMGSTERLLDQAEAGLAAAISPNVGSRPGVPPGIEGAAPFAFQSFEATSNVHRDGVGLHALHDVELDLRIELGRTELLIEEVLQLTEGSVVPLNKLAGDPVDILVNGRLIARGEVLVLNDNFCVRVAEIVAPTL